MEKEHVIPQFQVRTQVHSGQYGGGGWVNGVWYADKSGVCGGYVPPVPPTPPGPLPVPPPSGGGYVGGVWYPDRSGVCG